MTTTVALQHTTVYRFDRPVGIGPHVVRLRPAPHTRTAVTSYSLQVGPADHFVNWQQDPFGNYLARLVFPTPARELSISVSVVAELGSGNPFDFFVEPYAETFPFGYDQQLTGDLEPYLRPLDEPTPAMDAWLAGLPARYDALQTPRRTVDFLLALNQAVYDTVAYSVRMEAGVQSPDVTLERAIGSCRDSAWLLVAALRSHGLAARFVSGYLVQLTSDDPSQGGPTEDFTDLHAWAEVYLPGAGWIGLDPTSALAAGQGHIPLAATPHPGGAAPITGAVDPCEVTLEFSNTVRRVHEEFRPTKPYADDQWAAVLALGDRVDERIAAQGLELTQGGEPTFVSVDDMTSPEWTVAADGDDKRAKAEALADRLFERYAGVGGLIQRSQGKWYPGEALPRWQIGLIWRVDGEPLWTDPALLADPAAPSATAGDAAAAEKLARTLVADLRLPTRQARPCYEDPLAVLAYEVRLPAGPRTAEESVTPDLVERLDATQHPVAWAIPLQPAWWSEGWASPDWRLRRGRIVLVPGDSPAGQRLPLDALAWHDPDYEGEESYLRGDEPLPTLATGPRPSAVVVPADDAPARTALVVEARAGIVHVFLPPVERLERFLELIGLLDRASSTTGVPVVLEGYGPPPDPRIRQLLVTPDPGVIEVNVHPTSTWRELVELTETLYDDARALRLGAETFGPDGRHSGSGGGSHITLGGPEPSRSPLLRRPDLLVSLLTYWQHHPSLSYLFSGRFVGPTSQAPRVDEGRAETLYELEIAFDEIARLTTGAFDEREEVRESGRPWVVDRALRHLLTDITGNTHRAEFCVDKLYSPDSLRGRLGLLELRGFEMAPHARMALVQSLLVRSILARVAEQPYHAPLVRWGTQLHERFLLPHGVAADAAAVVADLDAHGFAFEPAWLDPFLEFRFPRIGTTRIGEVTLDLRTAIEPWQVLGEENSAAGTARYVDSSVERLQVSLTGAVPGRHLLTCNGVPVPLAGTDDPTVQVGGVRFRAWQPWSALHPTIEVQSPLVFDLVDVGSRLSLGGATYHVVHPGGRSYETPPVNADEAAARRARRFEPMGHTGGELDVPALLTRARAQQSGPRDYVTTLDLRRRR
jgi:uncharacterized protein (DUF2126 family)/transglutaminase-like putative cysteine protease